MCVGGVSIRFPCAFFPDSVFQGSRRMEKGFSYSHVSPSVLCAPTQVEPHMVSQPLRTHQQHLGWFHKLELATSQELGADSVGPEGRGHLGPDS